MNLAGFYDLAQSLGGVEVPQPPVYDEYSGADFPAGRQTLNAAQAAQLSCVNGTAWKTATSTAPIANRLSFGDRT